MRTGVLSGTLSLTFNQLNADPELAFSEAYEVAKRRKLTKMDSKEKRA